MWALAIVPKTGFLILRRNPKLPDQQQQHHHQQQQQRQQLAFDILEKQLQQEELLFCVQLRPN